LHAWRSSAWVETPAAPQSIIAFAGKCPANLPVPN
jgi:hypothetical protein